MMLASFVLEEDYAALGDLPTLFVNWLRIVGIMSMVTLLIWELFRLIRGTGSSFHYGLSGRLRNLAENEVWKIRAYRLFIVLSVLSLAALVLFVAFGGPLMAKLSKWFEWKLTPDQIDARVRSIRLDILTISCLWAVLAVSWEFIIDVPRFSFRRIWAIGLFSIREAIRGKVLWSFCLVLLVFLFASWFVKANKPEHQWKVYVDLVFTMLAYLILLTGAVLACFSLPTDIRNQTIHTVVTKPVQKFEIIFGRIVGITVLMTLILIVVSHVSLLYVFRGIDKEFRDDVMRARVRYTSRGDVNRGEDIKGLRFEELNLNGDWVRRVQRFSVGREWEYRQYIRGGAKSEAVWTFLDPPRSLVGREQVPVEFEFDIFRTTKGGEEYKEGVSCQFTFVNTAKWDARLYDQYREGLDPETHQPMTDQERARRFGYYELPAPITIVDYQTFRVTFPGAILEGLGNLPLEIRVSCRTPSQYVGMAQHDLYILADEGSFYFSYLKGMAGIWFLMVLVVSLGVVFSTVLSALIAFMSTVLLVACGVPRLRNFVQSLTYPADSEMNPAGGPWNSGLRIVTKQGLMTPIERGKAVWVIEQLDDLSRLFFHGFVSILPDLHEYNRTMFIAEGFNIPNDYLFTSITMLVGYVFPFLLAGYYLLNAREVAGAT
jgi:hypothetical protein